MTNKNTACLRSKIDKNWARDSFRHVIQRNGNLLPMKPRLHLIAVILSSVTASPLSSTEEGPFRQEIGVLLAKHCLDCHNERRRQGGLSLQTSSAALAGGESGEVIVAGDPDSSYLLDLIVAIDGKADMPKGGAPLSEKEISAIRRWIAAGADWPENVVLEPPVWWSLRPLAHPAVPHTTQIEKQAFAIRNPFDAFVLARLHQHGLSPSPAADRRTLMRRLYFDLIGLPPSPDEIQTFVGHPDPRAYERLVDRLLESPRYGERWTRHWLDVVHFGETHGYDKDKPRPHAWPYRDYVIRSFNEDKAYARFVQEHSCGRPDAGRFLESRHGASSGSRGERGRAPCTRNRLEAGDAEERLHLRPVRTQGVRSGRSQRGGGQDRHVVRLDRSPPTLATTEPH